MKKHFLYILTMAAFFAPVTASAQKPVSYYEPQSLFNQGLTLFQQQEYGAALEYFTRYIESVDDQRLQSSVDAQYYAAVSALCAGNPDAESRVKAFVNDNPGSTWATHANFMYANMLFKNKKYNDALAIYLDTPAASLNQDEAQQMQFNMGYAYMQTDQSDKALPLLQGLALNEGPYRDDARYYAAHLLYANGKDQEARQYFSALRSHPEYGPTVQAYILQIAHRSGDYQTVLDEGPDAVRKAEGKRKGEMALIVADAFFQNKEYTKALTYYDVFRRNASGRSLTREAYYQMGTCKMKTGDINGAIQDLQKAASDKDIAGQYASYYLASCYADTDQPKYARNAFYTAYAADFDHEISEDALFNYARLSLIPGTDPFNEAVAQLDNFISENPKSSRVKEAEELSVYLLLNAKENEEALRRLEQMKNKSNEMKNVYDDLLFTTGIQEYQSRQYDKAQAHFSKVVKSNQGGQRKAEACFWLGESAYAAGDLEAADRYIKQFKNNGSASEEMLALAEYDLGYVSFEKSNYDEAIKHFRSFILHCDDGRSDLKTDAYLRLGDCFFIDRSYDNAINYYDLATRIGKANLDYALYQQGLCYGAKGNANQKIEMLENLVQTYPSTTYYDKALFEIGNTHLVHGDKRSALSGFNRLINQRPRSPYARQALMKVGMIYYNNNQYDEALTNLKNLVENHPNTDESREALSIIRNIYMERNQLNDYFAYAEKAGAGPVEVSQQDSLAFATAENFYQQGQYQDAETALRYYFDNFKKGAYLLKAHHYAAECARKVGTDEEVKTHLLYIIRQPDNDYTDQSLLQLARIEYESGDYQQANEHYGRLATITDDPLRRLEALEGGMKSAFFLDNYNKAIEMGEDLIKSKELSKEQINQINHIVGKSYYMKQDYSTAMQWLEKSRKADKSVYGAESAYYSAAASFQMGKKDDAENKVFKIADDFSSHEYWVAKSFILLADVYVAKDNAFQAKETLRSVVDNCSIAELRELANSKLASIE